MGMFQMIRWGTVSLTLLTAVSVFAQNSVSTQSLAASESLNTENFRTDLKIIKISNTRIQKSGPSDAQWAEIPPFTNFFFPWEEETAPATSLKMCHDGDHIFFRYDVVDSEILVPGSPENEMDVCGGDRVEIFLDTSDRMSHYYGLEMDPSGRVLDYEARYYRQFNYPFSVPGVQVSATRNFNGYQVCGSLEIKTLKRLGLIHTLESGTCLRAGFFRAEFSSNTKKNEDGTQTDGVQEKWISWQSTGTPEPDFHVPTALGWIKLEEE